jgi:hypothetical protein
MNERIKELIAEADRKCSETRGIYDEILAELIVKECISVVYDQRGTDLGSERDFDIVNIALKIDRHFGVEE